MREAVSVVLKYQNEIFMVQRQNYLKAFPGYHSFPGGKVDEGDEAFAFSWPKWTMEEKNLGACRRELQEEINFDIEKALNEGNVIDCKHLGSAHTPAFNPYRYKSDFFLIELNKKIEFDLDENEASWGGWKKAEEFNELYQMGKILGVPPTIKLINNLANNQKNPPWNIDFLYDEENEVPCISSIKGVEQLIPLSNTLPPASRTNCFYLGDEGRKKVLVDPSPKDLKEYERLLNTIKDKPLDEIFLTHHHIDHREHAQKMAIEKQVPMGMSALTKKYIEKTDPEYLKNIEINIYQEGDVLTHWLGKEIKTIEVPGHDNGQLALMPDCRSWCLVGDLIQGIGTVVVSPKPEGSMSAYFKSLKKIINLNPKIIYPSHGIAMGGVFRLEQTLEHRQKREDKVLELLQKNLSVDEMLKEIYPDLDERLVPFAKVNIVGHIEKLEEEQAI